MGLDENLPSFHIADNKDSSKIEVPYLLTRGGNDPEPAYTLKHPDPSSPNAQNCYAAALFDAYNPEILFGEVLIRPRWTQPSLSQEEIRRNGGIPPPPEPVLPTEFTIQLYNPDLQIEVKREQSTFGGTHYDFAMPQDTFRLPSSSSLDRAQHDPAASLTTPKVNFSFKREGKLSKDMVLHMTGRSTDVVHKKKSKEPDISIALFKALRELTVYEPNLYRVEMEDPKGLEVTVLLLATVIKDVYYGSLRHAFNVTDESVRRRTSNPISLGVSTAPRKSSDPSHLRKNSQPPSGPRRQQQQSLPMMSGGLNSHPPDNPNLSAGAAGLYARPAASTSHLPDPRKAAPRRSDPGLPITDPKTQWQIDAETARLRQQSQAEQQATEQHRREQERRDEAESRRLRKQLEAEEKDRKRKEREVQKETERLRRIYGDQSQLANPPTQAGTAAPVPPQQQQSQGRPVAQPVYSRPSYPSYPQQQRPAPVQQQPAMPQQIQRPPQQQAQRPNNVHPQNGSSAFNAGASVGNLLGVGGGGNGRKSMWNLRGKSEESRLTKKRSSVW